MKNSNYNQLMSFMIWFCITLFYCYQYVLRVVPNIIMPDLMASFSIGASEFGSFAGIYYIGYISIHIPVGILLIRFGSRKILAICILLSGLSLAPIIYSDSWMIVLAGRLLTGIGSSAAIVGALQIFRVIYPDSFTRMLGIMVSLSLITVVYAGGPLAQFITYFGLDKAINILIICGIALAVITYGLMPKSTDHEHASTIWHDVKEVLTNYKIVIVSLFAGLMVGPLEGFADAWGSAFLIQVYGMEKSVADNTVLTIFLGMCGGSIIIPYIADKTRSYYGVTIFSGIVMCTCFAYVLSLQVAAEVVGYLCVIIGIFCSYQVIIIAKISTFVREDQSGMAASIANMIIMTFGWVFHNSIGFALDRQWNGVVVDGVKHYDSTAFASSLMIIPAAIIVALVGIFVISRIEARAGRE